MKHIPIKLTPTCNTCSLSNLQLDIINKRGKKEIQNVQTRREKEKTAEKGKKLETKIKWAIS